MLNELPEDVIEIIIKMSTFICDDCEDKTIKYPNLTKRICLDCGLCVCRAHSAHRFSSNIKTCNNCIFGLNGQLYDPLWHR